MGRGWLKEVLEENRREIESWPDWKKDKSTEPTTNAEQSSETNQGEEQKEQNSR